MSTPLSNIVDQIRVSTDYQANKRILKERIKTELLFTYNGGLFLLDPALLAFVSTWPTDTLYLEDTYENPIEIDKQVFLVQAQQHYYRVMNDWHQQHAELKRTRKV